MATIAVSGVPPLAIFHSLARFERYGEVSREANSIIRDSETFGYDITEAIKRKADRTPSEDFRRLLIGMASGINTGGNLSSFLNEAASSITEKHRNMWKDVIERLSMYSEAYVTIFVAGPIFFIVMGSMMGLIGGGSINPVILMEMFIYLAIPAANVMYLLFIEATIPKME
ncbi:flagellar assembly protein J [archaeon]|nr:flagellar assembly protein J [archaeon]